MHRLPEGLHFRMEQLRSWITNRKAANNAMNLLDTGFDLDKSGLRLNEEDIRDIIFSNIIGDDKRIFFVISSDIAFDKMKYSPETISMMQKSEWYMLVNPRGTTHLILVKKQLWISFNAKGQLIVNECKNGDAWGYSGGTFQPDKFSSHRNPVLSSDLLPHEVIGLLHERFNF